MIWAADTFPACHSSLWDRVTGWEVVAAVFLIMVCWAATNVGRQYFMWRIAATNTCNHCGHEKDEP